MRYSAFMIFTFLYHANATFLSQFMAIVIIFCFPFLDFDVVPVSGYAGCVYGSIGFGPGPRHQFRPILAGSMGLIHLDQANAH